MADIVQLGILHVVAPGAVGGLERIVQALAIGQRRLGHAVHVAAVVDGPGPDHWLLRALPVGGVVTHPLVLPGRAYRRERRAIAEICRRIKPDVVHTHGSRPDVVDAGVARCEGIPVVTTVHGFTGGDWKNRFYEWLQRRAFRRFDAVVAVSRPLAAELVRAGVPRPRVHCVPNAWRPTAPPLSRAAARRALGVPDDRFLVGWVGRLSHEKGMDILLDALGHVADLPLAVAVLGDGVERAALQARARHLGLDDRIAWHGMVPDAARLFTGFDVFALSSRTEGTPMVLFEAMATEVPIVATHVGGVPDVVSRREAVLVPPEEPVALAAAVRGVLRSRTAAAQRARAARERLRREFGVEQWVERYRAIYRAITRLPAAEVSA